MSKILFQGLTIVLLFFAVLFGLSQIDWMSVFHVKQVTESTEKKLGDLFWDFYLKSEKEINSNQAKAPLDSILNHICSKNHLNRKEIKLHLIRSEEVNAFAFPNGHLIVNSGLIVASENEQEVCGVLCHEIAHIQLKHVMKKLVKEVGLSMLITMTSSNGGSEKIKETAKLLSSSAYDRNLEKEADIKAVDYLQNAYIDPQYFANFLYRLGDSESESMKYFSWISTHPESKERAEYVINYSKDKTIKSDSILTQNRWERLKHYLSEE
ncbi:MAG: M48 family metallopeptidase [Bacteroidetes bacterium]|nr:M48 family metallopeptidase [Bacteroidota bacterium]